MSSCAGGHSAAVEMQLVVGGAFCSILQMMPDQLVVEAKCEAPPGEAQVTLRVDGRAESWRVFSPDGVRLGVHRVALAPASAQPVGTPGV